MNKNKHFHASHILTVALALLLCAGCTKKAKEARYFKEGEQFFKSGEYDKAKIDYLKVLRLNPQNATAFARLGAIWLDEGAPLRAGRFLEAGRTARSERHGESSAAGSSLYVGRHSRRTRKRKC